MNSASTLGAMSPELLRVVERAQQEPEGRFHSLAHLVDGPALERAYRRMRKDAAVGVDGVTKGQGRAYQRALCDALGLDEMPRFELWFIDADRLEVVA